MIDFIVCCVCVCVCVCVYLWTVALQKPVGMERTNFYGLTLFYFMYVLYVSDLITVVYLVVVLLAQVSCEGIYR